jgi:ribosomal protein S18 acetylase RimI-like enzyme
MDRALEAAGWKLSWESPGMRCDLTTSESIYTPRKEFLILPVRTAEDVKEWLNPFMDGFQVNSGSRSYLQQAWEKVAGRSGHPMRNYLLLHDGKGITTGSIQFKYGVAVIYNISTVKEDRGRGGATEMVKFLKAVARKEGYDSVSLFALKAGQPIYERLGFRENSARNRVVCLDSLSRND